MTQQAKEDVKHGKKENAKIKLRRRKNLEKFWKDIMNRKVTLEDSLMNIDHLQ